MGLAEAPIDSWMQACHLAESPGALPSRWSEVFVESTWSLCLFPKPVHRGSNEGEDQ